MGNGVTGVFRLLEYMSVGAAASEGSRNQATALTEIIFHPPVWQGRLGAGEGQGARRRVGLGLRDPMNLPLSP